MTNGNDKQLEVEKVRAILRLRQILEANLYVKHIVALLASRPPGVIN